MLLSATPPQFLWFRSVSLVDIQDRQAFLKRAVSGSIPGDWSWKCPQYGYGDVLMIEIYTLVQLCHGGIPL
jgi:hypothetical protein